MSSMGERIKAARIEKGVGRGEFAKMLKCTYTAVHNWEERGMSPRPHMLSRIAKVLGVSEQSLMKGGDSKKPSSQADLDDLLRKAEEEVAALLRVPVYRVKLKLEIMSK